MPCSGPYFLIHFIWKERIGMTDYISAYETYLLESKHASANTVSSYMRDIKQFEHYAAVNLEADLESVTKEQLEVYFASLRRSPVKRIAWGVSQID